MLKDLMQPSHLIIVGVLLVVLFGWKRLPDAARSVGRSMRIFKSEVSEMKNDGKDGHPSAAASDTVPGGVVPQPSAQPQPAPSTAPAGTPQAQAPQYAAPQYADATQPQYQPPVQPQYQQPAQQPTQPQYQGAPQNGQQPVPQAQPERHDTSNPAL